MCRNKIIKSLYICLILYIWKWTFIKDRKMLQSMPELYTYVINIIDFSYLNIYSYNEFWKAWGPRVSNRGRFSKYDPFLCLMTVVVLCVVATKHARFCWEPTGLVLPIEWLDDARRTVKSRCLVHSEVRLVFAKALTYIAASSLLTRGFTTHSHAGAANCSVINIIYICWF